MTSQRNLLQTIALRPLFLPMLILLAPLAHAVDSSTTLIAYAELAADTFRSGPDSGAFIEPVNGRQPPFVKQQPVQGFSALLSGNSGLYLVLSDNGFGKRSNSADYLLSIYYVRPDFRTTTGGTGSIEVERIIRLSDPESYLPYTISRQTDRLLTGADLDPESFQMAPDGSFWIAEEFYPSLLHFSAEGVLLASPFTLNGLASVDNPEGKTATLPRSRGFEGMAISADARHLFPLLEGTISGQEPALNIYTFDIENQRFVNEHANSPSYRYRLEQGSTAIGAFKLYSATAGLVLERDSGEGVTAHIKKVYAVDFTRLDADGYLEKTLVADLLNISDPHDLNRDGSENFSFPFYTIEGLLVIDANTLAIVNDNNYPFGQAREADKKHIDNNEFIIIRLPSILPGL